MCRYHHQEYNSKNYISLTRNSEFNFEVLGTLNIKLLMM